MLIVVQTLGVLRSGRRKRPVQLLKGPYGLYVKCGDVMANMPKVCLYGSFCPFSSKQMD